MVVGTDLQSFARAASQLGRSQSAVSMQLKKLEEQAGRPLFRRIGRGLVPTEAGDALLNYARRIVALNDEAATSLGATATAATVRLGLPQDLLEDIMPGALAKFARSRPNVHVEVRAGRNHVLAEEIGAGRLDVALGFFPVGSDTHGTRVCSMPMVWLSGKGVDETIGAEPLPLVLYDHPCLFRQTALQALERKKMRWRLVLTTPSVPGIWAALRSMHGITVRTAHRLPAGIRDVSSELNLPKLPRVELRMLTASRLSPAASDLKGVLDHIVSQLG